MNLRYQTTDYKKTDISTAANCGHSDSVFSVSTLARRIQRQSLRGSLPYRAIDKAAKHETRLRTENRYSMRRYSSRERSLAGGYGPTTQSAARKRPTNYARRSCCRTVRGYRSQYRWELLDCDIADFKFTVSLYDTSRKGKPSGAK